MEDIETAARLLGLEPKWLQPFDVDDPFNDHRLTGFLSIKPDHRYGALAITHVSGVAVPQRIFATPKLHYPLDRQGTFHFPAVRKIAIYEKLDGTNVLAFRYVDAHGVARTTYKLRLSAALRNGKWGPFLDLWKEMIGRYPGIPRLAEKNGCSVSMELYGARNPHLVLYDAPLECAVLFGVTDEGVPIPPDRLDTLGVPVPRRYGELEAGQDPVARYALLREEMERGTRSWTAKGSRGPRGRCGTSRRPAGRPSSSSASPSRSRRCIGRPASTSRPSR